MVSGIRSCNLATSATVLPSESQRMVWARCLSRQWLRAWSEESVVHAVLS